MPIAVLVCYYGKFPWYFDYFILSCKYNPTIDFYIFSDDKTYIGKLPGNVQIIYKTLDEISLMASDKMGFSINIENAYKLCDFKPAYGLLFSDFIKKYSFWAHSDIDIIFGDIRNFITNDILNNYDLISLRPDWLSGCFLLFRNNEKMKNLFKLSKDYKKVFCSHQHYCFDETNFAHADFTEGKEFNEVQTEIESMMHVVKKMEKQHYLKPYFDLHIIEGTPGKLKWIEGKLIYKNRYEALLYHMIFLKQVYLPKKKANIPTSKIFSISPSRIYHIE